MDIIYYPQEARCATPPDCVIALGFFDGVHLAHRKLLDEGMKMAKELGLPLAVFTFPSESKSIKMQSPRIYSTEQKLSLLSECGVSFVILSDFAEVSSLSADLFINKLLIEEFHCKGAVCGFNFKFGKGAAADSSYLSSMLSEKGIPTKTVEEIKFRDIPLSSTYIRELLASGKLEEANEALGKPYFTTGKVERGLGIGAELGIPTVNTPMTQNLSMLPGGVYESLCLSDGKLYRSITNIGSCPTFGSREPHLETFLLDFKGDLYGKNITVYLLSFIREEREFPNGESLIKQIEEDVKKVNESSGIEKWQTIGLK